MCICRINYYLVDKTTVATTNIWIQTTGFISCKCTNIHFIYNKIILQKQQQTNKLWCNKMLLKFAFNSERTWRIKIFIWFFDQKKNIHLANKKFKATLKHENYFISPTCTGKALLNLKNISDCSSNHKM